MDRIIETIIEAKSVGITGHVRPDGDSVGACMALYNYLIKNYPEKETDVYLEYVPEEFLFLENTDQIKTSFEREAPYDVFVSLDCGDLDRITVALEGFQKAGITINIDHHISNVMFGDVNHIDENRSSTSEILYHFFDKDKIDRSVAEAIYLGIVHDTGVFKHSNTSPETMKAAAWLIKKGVPFSKIIDETFYQKTYIQNQLLGRCLLESILILDGRCIFSVVDRKAIDFFGARSSDLDGVIDQLRITKGVEVAILLQEIDSREYKVSMRSNEIVDVRKIAVYFGGGGHIKAAGCTMKGSFHDVINNLTLHIEAQMKAQIKECEKNGQELA